MKLSVTASIIVLVLFSTQASSEVFLTSKTDRIFLSRILKDLELMGPKDELIDDLGEFVEKRPYSSLTDRAILKLAEIYEGKKEFEGAAACYEKLIEDFPPVKSKQEALYGLAYCRFLGGRLDRARELSAYIEKSSETPEEVKLKALELTEEISELIPFLAVVEPREAIIGTVLPLSGDYAPFGEKALKGVRLAALVFGKANFPVKIKIVDSNAKEPVTRLRKLIDDQNVVGLVGPLLSKTALSVARFAQKENIPVIVISQKTGVAQLGGYVFRNFLTPGQQAATIARYAYSAMGLRRFAILYPSNRYGTELANSFKRELERLGAEVVSEKSYKQKQTDFSAELEYLFAIEVEEGWVGRRRVTTYNPTEEIDAIYIPDYYKAVSLIAPFLVYYEVQDVMLLGSNGWNSPRLVELAGGYVEGSVFVDGFFPRSTRAASAEFVRRFKGAYGYEPGIIEAQAYDAAMLIFQALKQGPVNREGLKDRLLKIKYPKGATGKITFDRSGEARKELFLLTVEGGEIVELMGP